MGEMADKVHSDIHWDEEARESAMRQAQQTAKRDPEAAALLVTQLIAVQETEKEQGIENVRPPVDYNPLKLYAFIARETGWKPREIDEMHYLTFFGIVREINARVHEENNAYKGLK